MQSKILVTYATKYGATQGIAEKIGEVLQTKGLQVDVLNVKQVKNVADYQGVVLGSAAYIFQWRPEAVSFIKKNQAALAERPVWFFSSGPLEEGDPVEAVEGRLYPTKLKTVMEQIHPKTITVFHGALYPEKLNPLEKWMMKKFPVAKNDYRDWEAISAWAEKIAAELTVTA